MADVAIRIPGIQRMPGGFRRRISNYNLQRRDVTECAQWCDDSHRLAHESSAGIARQTTI